MTLATAEATDGHGSSQGNWTIRPASRRGTTRMSWLTSHHTFSFGSYFDPTQQGFRTLRVINDDVIAPGAGFATHGHRDMEILTYLLSGAVEHQDSLGSRSVLPMGEAQLMSAGSGILHSEFNHLTADPTHLLQIWILPERTGLTPSYRQEPVPHVDGWTLLAAPEGEPGLLPIHQNARVLVGRSQPGTRLTYDLQDGRGAWLQVVRGSLAVDGHRLDPGDGASTESPGVLTLDVGPEDPIEVLLFDLG